MKDFAFSAFATLHELARIDSWHDQTFIILLNILTLHDKTAIDKNHSISNRSQSVKGGQDQRPSMILPASGGESLSYFAILSTKGAFISLIVLSDQYYFFLVLTDKFTWIHIVLFFLSYLLTANLNVS